MSEPLSLTRSTTALVVIMKCLVVSRSLLGYATLFNLAAFQANAFQNNAFQCATVDLLLTMAHLHGALYRAYRELCRQGFVGSLVELERVIVEATGIVEQMRDAARSILPTPQTAAQLDYAQLIFANGYDEIQKAI